MKTSRKMKRLSVFIMSFVFILTATFFGTPALVVSAAADQASQLTARHYEGQTILTWDEVSGVAASITETMTAGQVRELRQSLANTKYNIYRALSPITSVAGLTPVKTAGVLSGWNDKFYGEDYSSRDKQSFRYVAEKDTNGVAAGPVSKDTAVCAYNPPNPGTAYYAVTAVVNGVENTSLSAGNTFQVEETTGQGIPILQRVEKINQYLYTSGTTTHNFYTRWEAPPNSNIQGRPIDYLVAFPANYDSSKPSPAVVAFHAWGGNLTYPAPWWFNYPSGTILIASNEEPYDWWTGYHEKYGIEPRTQQNWQSGVVRPYTQNRLNSFIDWVNAKWSLDYSRIIAGGASMGGSGSIMFGIRNPGRVAWVNSWVGVHVPAESPTFQSSYNQVYGDYAWQLKYQDGVTPAFSYFDDDWYLRNHIQDETPFLAFSNGKNDGSIGWGQAVKFLRALQETKRPFKFTWGQGGHGQRVANAPNLDGVRDEVINGIDMSTTQSMPAFNNCSLDNNPGNGDPNNGDPEGNINAYMYWKTNDIVDQPDKWEMTVGIVKSAPTDSCTVSLTPRRLQNFKATPGAKFKWTNTALNTNQTIQSGEVLADSNGLVTIDNLNVGRITREGGGNRIAIILAIPGETGHAPVLSAIGNKTINEGDTLTFAINATDSDPGTVLNYSASGLPEGADFSPASRTLSWKPGYEQSGKYKVRFTVSDGALNASEEIEITVNDANQGGNFTKITVTNTDELLASVQTANRGNIIVEIADGIYEGTASKPLSLILRGNNIIYRSQSGNRDRVILKGNFQGGSIFDIEGDNITIQDISISEAYWHGIQLHSEMDADYAVVKNVHFYNIREQMFKGSADDTETYSNNCLVENCLFDYPAGVATQGYNGGLDVHRGQNWIVRNNIFKNIRYPGALTDGAIHFWRSSSGTVIENNTIINCDRGIVLGLNSQRLSHTGGIIRNNFIHATVDTGIYVDNTIDTKIYNNTVYVDSNYGSAIEYRYTMTTGVQIVNNLANRQIWQREGASARVENNIVNAQANWFVNASAGDLHLASDVAGVVNSGINLADVTTDIDGEARPSGQNDIGADERVSGTTNHPPVLAAIGNKAVNKGAALSITVNAADADTADTLTYRAEGLPAGAAFNASTRIFTWTPSLTQSGSYTIRFTVSDGKASDTEDVVINVSDVTQQNPGGILINHSSTNLSIIPESWITSAKSKLHIAYGHTSHGSQLTTGMTGLANFKGSLYAWNDGGANGALDIDDAPFAVGDLGSGDWARVTRSYLLNHPATNVIIWSWCGQVSSATNATINTYLSSMSKLEADFPNVKFVYMTGHLDGSGLNGNLNLRNEQIRKYCRDNNKILYDFADIESYNPDGEFFADKLANDSCDYDSDGNKTLDKNWAVEWQNSHTRGVDWYSCDAAHTQPLNGNQKAAAAWALWARLAGWQATDEPITPVNHPPVLAAIGSKSLKAGTAISFTVSASDIDEGTTLTYIAGNLPAGASFDPATRAFSWTPGAAQLGSFTVSFKVSDGKLEDSEDVVITVNSSADTTPPSAPSNLTAAAASASSINLSWTASTDNVAVAGYNIYRNGVKVNTCTSGRYADKDLNPATRYTYYVTAFDAANNTSGRSNETSTKTIAIPVNHAPVLSCIGAKKGSQGIGISFTIIGKDADTGSTLTYSATGLPEGASFNSETLTFSWTPASNQGGTYIVRFMVSDGELTDYEDVSFTIKDKQAPSIPTGVVTTVVSRSQIDISWTPSTDNSGVTGYYIYRDGAKIGTSSINSFSDTNIKVGVKYSYKIKAFDAGQNISASSAAVSGYCKPETNADLKDLSVSNCAISFDTDIYKYQVKIDKGITGVTVLPVTADSNATVRVNGKTVKSGSESQTIILDKWSNKTISIEVKAEDKRTYKTYKIIFTR